MSLAQVCLVPAPSVAPLNPSLSFPDLPQVRIIAGQRLPILANTFQAGLAQRQGQGRLGWQKSTKSAKHRMNLKNW